MCIVPFRDEAEVIRRGNNCDYGLAASVWSSNVGRLTRVAQALRVRETPELTPDGMFID